MIDPAEIYKTIEWKAVVCCLWTICFIAISPRYPWSDQRYATMCRQLNRNICTLEEKYGVRYRTKIQFGNPNYLGIANEKDDWIFKMPLTSR